MKICEHCQKRYTVMLHVGDYVHNCGDLNSNTTLGKDDVFIYGDATDADGNTFTRPPQEVMRQGVENSLFGTHAWVDGADEDPRTSRGRKKATHRQIDAKAYKEFDKDGN